MQKIVSLATALCYPRGSMSRRAAGVSDAFGAYLVWGSLGPIYFKEVRSVPALEIASHREVWSMLLLCAVVGVSRRWAALRALFAQPRSLALVLYSGEAPWTARRLVSKATGCTRQT